MFFCLSWGCLFLFCCFLSLFVLILRYVIYLILKCMLKKSLLATLLVGGCLTATADDLRSTAINNAAAAEKVKADVTAETQDSVHWKFPCKVGLNLGQNAYNDYWAEANVNSLTFNLYADLQANYKNGRKVWTNELYGEYGIIYSSDYEDYHTRKALDKLTFTSKYGYQSSKCQSLYYAALFDAKTQFAPGYDYAKVEGTDIIERERNSDFLAPLSMIGSLGMEYVPNKWVSVFFSPITARAVYCRVDDLREQCGLDSTENFKIEPGLYLRVQNSFDIVKNVNLSSKLEYFYAYYGAKKLDLSKNEWFGPIDYHSVINWDLLLTMKVNNFLQASVRGQIKWEAPIVERFQVMEAINVGLAYSF